MGNTNVNNAEPFQPRERPWWRREVEAGLVDHCVEVWTGHRLELGRLQRNSTDTWAENNSGQKRFDYVEAGRVRN